MTIKNQSVKKVEFSIQGLPPIHSPESERAVLGAMLSDPQQCVDMAAEQLQAEDFFQPAHQVLFHEMTEMRNLGKAIDPATLLQWLADRQLAERVGGAQLMGELSASIVSVLTFPTHLETVRHKSLLRHLQQAGAKIAYDAHDRQHEALTVLDESERLIFEMGSREAGGGVIPMRAGCASAIEMMDRAIKMKGRMDGITTGLSDLDTLTTGFKPGEMIVIAARPGVGKTALALSMAKNIIKERYDLKQERFVKPGLPVAFFSLEMTAEQLMLRLIASHAQIDLQNIRKGRLTEMDLNGISIAVEELADLPLYVDESSFLTINQLRAKARRMKKLYNIEAIFIDYLQLLTAPGRGNDNRQVEVAEISRGIKALAKELKLPIIVLAQLNRKPEEGGNEPALHHLRESGSIEQDADVVLLVSRSFEGDQVVNATINVAKQRNGPTDKITVEFVRGHTEFRDIPRKF
jgi:replicative DNA helicase